MIFLHLFSDEPTTVAAGGYHYRHPNIIKQVEEIIDDGVSIIALDEDSQLIGNWYPLNLFGIDNPKKSHTTHLLNLTVNTGGIDDRQVLKYHFTILTSKIWVDEFPMTWVVDSSLGEMTIVVSFHHGSTMVK